MIFGCDFSPKIESSFYSNLIYIFYFSIYFFAIIFIANSLLVAKCLHKRTWPKAPYPMTLPNLYMLSTFFLTLNFLKSYICNEFFLTSLSSYEAWRRMFHPISLRHSSSSFFELKAGTDTAGFWSLYFFFLPS